MVSGNMHLHTLPVRAQMVQPVPKLMWQYLLISLPKSEATVKHQSSSSEAPRENLRPEKEDPGSRNATWISYGIVSKSHHVSDFSSLVHTMMESGR